VEAGFLADPARSSKGQQYLYAGGSNMYGLLVTLEPELFLVGSYSLWGGKPPSPV
jgi:hypothetical protein